LITVPENRPFGAARSGIFNHRLEEGRFNDIITVLETKKILALFRRFRSYRNQGGLYPISSFIDASLHPVLFNHRDPTPEELANDELFQQLLENYIPDMSYSELKDLYQKKFSMRPISDGFKNFQVTSYLKYKSEMLLFWNDHLRFLKLDARETFKTQRDWFIDGSTPESFQSRFRSEARAAKTIPELITIFDREVQIFKTSVDLYLANCPKPKSQPATPAVAFAMDSPKSPAEKSLGSTPTSTARPFGQRHSSPPPASSGSKKVKKVSKTKSSDDEVKVFDPGVLDSGSSVHTVPSKSYLTTSVSSVDSVSGPLLAANDTKISILGKGDSILPPNITLTDVLITPSIGQPIISPQLIIKDNNASILLSDKSAYLVNNSISNKSAMQSLINNSICIATLDSSDNLYKTPSFTSSPIPATVNTIRRYATIAFKTLAEEVSYWHSALIHPDVEVMVQTFATPIFKKSHPHLTAKVIRKYFPTSCPDCPVGNFQMRHPPVDPVIHHGPGEVFEVDIQGKWTDAAGKPAKSFSGDIYAFAAIDCASDLVFARTIQTRVSLVDHLEALRLSALSTGKELKVIRTDNEYITLLSKAWALSHNVSFQPSIPFEHNTVRRVERVHRKLQEMVVKSLAHKSHLSPEYWSMCYMHCVDLHNVLPNRDSGISPFERYHGFAPDLGFSPILPFGSVVMAHLPLQLQTTLSGRAVEAVYVGRAPLHRDAILVFNPQTKRTLIRHSFKFLSVDEPVSTTYVFGNPNVSVDALHNPDDSDVPNSELVPDKEDEFTFIPVLLSKCASRYKFAFDYLQQCFTETTTSSRYCVHDIVKLSTSEVDNIYCFQYYDVGKFSVPPTSPSDFEYDPSRKLFKIQITFS
jgi:hypothetical protein